MTSSTVLPTDVLDTVEVLADPLRREIVRRLGAQQLCTCHLVEMTGAPQPTVSYHLKVLRDAGWVTSAPAGRYTYYSLEADAVSALADALGGLATQARAGVDRRPACD